MPVNVTYSTFWNDFSHYSVYGHNYKDASSSDFRIDLGKVEEDNFMFEEEDKYSNFASPYADVFERQDQEQV